MSYTKCHIYIIRQGGIVGVVLQEGEMLCVCDGIVYRVKRVYMGQMRCKAVVKRRFGVCVLLGCHAVCIES